MIPRRWAGLMLAIAGITAAMLVASMAIPGPDRPELIRVGVLPDESPDLLRDRYAPLLNRMAEHTGIRTELVIPRDYSGLVRLFEEGRIDLAYFGGLTFLQAEERARAIPLVSRDVDLNFKSYFLVPNDSPVRAISEMHNLRFAFGSNLSTSGHLMPRFFMQRDGIDPEQRFSEILYSGAHDRTIYWLLEGRADAGVANAAIVDAMLADGRLPRGALRIIGQTPPYADYVWAVRPGFPKRQLQAIRDLFLSLTPDRTDDLVILRSLQAGSFLPVLSTDFMPLRQVAVMQGLLENGERQ